MGVCVCVCVCVCESVKVSSVLVKSMYIVSTSVWDHCFLPLCVVMGLWFALMEVSSNLRVNKSLINLYSVQPPKDE